MAVPFALLSLLGTVIFFHLGAAMGAILFLLMTLIYLTGIPTRMSHWEYGNRLAGFLEVLAALWLLYLTFFLIAHIVIGAHP